MPVLETKRLVLRPMRRTDAAALHAAWGDAQVMRYWDWPAMKSAALTAQVIDAQVEEMEQHLSIYWSVCLAGQSKPFGAVDLSDIDTHHRRAEVGFILAKKFWREGYALEAMMAVKSYALDALNLERLTARTHTGNKACMALLRRLGFKHEGTLKAYVWRQGQRRDCEMFGFVAKRKRK